MPSVIDLTGRKFHKLTVIRFIESRRDPGGHMRRIYEVRCECGVTREAIGTDVSYGSVKSCGCLKHDGSHSVTHGHTRGGWSPEYRTWQSMLRRCLTPSASNFWKYGAKGVKVCQRWRDSFDAFLADMGPKPSPKHSIDRIDSGGNYEPSNCRWATASEQNLNRRPFKQPLRRKVVANAQ